ncbi:unknown [Firmicutes bacterium CAG:822]|nr:unknown [Firmicutes bacterium CAG:822]
MDFNDKLFDFLVATDQLDNFLGKNSKDKEKKRF